MTTPKLSIIIPTYNRAQYLREAIDSVLSQTYRDFEIIVVDDGSTDNTKEVAKKWELLDKVKYFYQENKGPAAARNRGIKEAMGDYIAFLDADDLWLPEKLEKQVEYLKERPDVSLVASEFEIIDEVGHSNGYSQRRKKIPVDGFILKYIFQHYLLLSTIMVKKDTFKTVGLFNEELINAEDTDILLRIAKHFKIGLLDEYLVKHREHKVSLTGIINSSRGRDGLKAIENFLSNEKGFAEQNKHLVNEVLSEAYFDYAEDLLSLDKFEESRINMKKCLEYKLSLKNTILFCKVVMLDLLGTGFVSSLRTFKRRICLKCSQFLHI